MKLTLSEEDRSTLTCWAKSRAVGIKQKQRAKLVLMTADGYPSQDIQETLGISAPTVNLWRRRYLGCGVEGLKKGKTRPSRVPPLASGGKGARGAHLNVER